MNQNLRLSRGYIATLVLAIAAVVVVFVWSPRPKHYWSGEGVIWTTDYYVTCETTNIAGKDKCWTISAAYLF